MHQVRSKAFSLVEAVIVLLIVSLIFSLPNLQFKNLTADYQIKNTRRQVEALINQAARRSILESKSYRINCYNSDHQLQIKTGGNIKNIDFDPEVQIINLSNLRISDKGTVSPRTITLVCHGKREKITVQMNWGRMIDSDT